MPLTTMPLSASIQTFQTLVLSYHPVIVIETVEEERVQNLLQTAVQDMKMQVYEWSITQGLIRSPGSADNRWVDECAPPGSHKPAAFEGTTDPLKVLQYMQEMTSKGIFWFKDFARHLEDAEVARQFRELVQLFSEHRSTIVLTGCTVKLPPEIAHDAVNFDLKLPGREELDLVVSDVIRSLRIKNRVHVELDEKDVPMLVQALMGMTLKQARQVIAYAALDDGKLTLQDVHRILQRKAQIIREDGVLEFFPLEELPIDLGGFSGLKQWLNQARLGFSPQAQALNLKPPKGILIVGIQGCGKSLAAKAIARAWKMPLLKLDTGRLYDKYVGESEKNFRQAITLAESMAPAVLWIDEIEKAMGGVNSSDADGGLTRRMFGSFLTWMQEKSQEVFVVATANDLSQLPPELLRKGRFDEIFFVDLPNEQERAIILQLHLTRRKQNPQHFDLPKLIQATDGFSGSEIEQAIISALYRALYLQKPLDTVILIQAIDAIIPLSISRKEDLQRLRTFARERFVSVQ